MTYTKVYISNKIPQLPLYDTTKKKKKKGI